MATSLVPVHYIIHVNETEGAPGGTMVTYSRNCFLLPGSYAWR